MKILSIPQIREADAYTIENEPVKSIDLMERAANACTKWICENINLNNPFVVFCGQGNNGGDGLAIARQLKTLYSQTEIRVFIVPQKNPSPDFLQNLEKLQTLNSIEITFLQENDPIEHFPKNTLFIDAILGSGLSKPIDGVLQKWIAEINKQNLETVIAIDVSTGLFCDQATSSELITLKATHTLTFEFPKIAFLMKDNYPSVGNFTILPIGIHKQYKENVSTNEYLITEEFINSFLKKRDKFSHKGNFGHALLIAGSYGKTGAAVLAAKACLRSGVGLLTVHIPAKSVDILQISAPEAMLSIDENETCFGSEIHDFSKYTAVGIGPGLGLNTETRKAFAAFIENCHLPLVLDADALNMLSLDKSLLEKLPKNPIFTPHIGEFERLTGKKHLSAWELWKEQKQFAKKYKLIVILKGAHTCICLPSGESFFNNNGNPGMSTGGSGDVLTGIITAFLAQGYEPWQAAVMGVFFHGKAGDKAAKLKGEQALLPSDIIDHL